MKTNTPWGFSQDSHTIAPGIVRHDTPSHGGYSLSPDRLAEMPAALRAFPPFAGEGWYEEDCDWAVVVLAFPLAFSHRQIAAAVRMVRGWNKIASAWLDTPEGRVVADIEARWVEAMGAARMYESGCAGTSGRGWSVSWRPIGHNGPRLECQHEQYPAGDMSADALAALGAVAAG